MRKIGDRIGAVLSMKDGIHKLLGYGTYSGDEIPTEAVGQMADMARDVGLTNPKLMLDNGTVVYGCECWWDDESIVKKRLADKQVVNVNINDVRREFKETEMKGSENSYQSTLI